MQQWMIYLDDNLKQSGQLLIFWAVAKAVLRGQIAYIARKCKE